MAVTKETKSYVISLTQQALKALRNNQFEDAEDLLRSAKGELHDANMNTSHMSVGGGFDVVPSYKKLKFLK